jgi:hypothetical protein
VVLYHDHRQAWSPLCLLWCSTEGEGTRLEGGESPIRADSATLCCGGHSYFSTIDHARVARERPSPCTQGPCTSILDQVILEYKYSTPSHSSDPSFLQQSFEFQLWLIILTVEVEVGILIKAIVVGFPHAIQRGVILQERDLVSPSPL